MRRKAVYNLVLSSMFMALGLVLPFLTGQIPEIGSMLLPMHVPVLLCGLICGPRYGVTVGFITPLFRTLLFAIPPLYPTAIAMAFELAAYGFFAGFLFGRARWQCLRSLMRCLVTAMLIGRAVWGVVMLLLLGVGANGFTWGAFFAGAFASAVPGIVLQLLLIPSVMLILNRTHLVPFRHEPKGGRADVRA